MDREIPKEVRQKERNKKLIRYGVSAAAVIVVISVLISVMRTGVKEKDVVFSTVDRGTIEVSDHRGQRQRFGQGGAGVRRDYQFAHQHPHRRGL